jgi:hypothetical protein
MWSGSHWDGHHRDLGRKVRTAGCGQAGRSGGVDRATSTLVVVLTFIAFIVLRAINYTVVSVMGLLVTKRLGRDVIGAGLLSAWRLPWRCRRCR